ncbi:sulfatase-like hydrolase/transferase, partial [Histophilus somni]|uniref:sulfatase-like hydrolase/transferase n=1 Tax=Histophilus somni TaxID=731 RepID=UPI00201E987D
MKKNKNIILIISDDEGYWSLGCYGNKEIITPNIDKLSKDGVIFKDFYCVSPVCSPARASILTGKIPSFHGVHDWIEDSTPERKTVNYMENLGSYVDVLAKNGYKCGLSGKWHLGNSSQLQMGFNHWYAHQSGGGPYFGAPMYRDGKLYYEESYITD